METTIVACVDNSAYAQSVCEHAAWLCGQMERAAISVVHADESDPARENAERLLLLAREQLKELGATDVESRCVHGGLAAELQTHSRSLLVLGKRGEQSAEDRRDLGATAAAVLRNCKQPLCLVSRLYLPISRALVLIDAHPAHRRTVETVEGNAVLRDLELDIVMMQPAGTDGSEKLEWARTSLGKGTADVYSMDHTTPEAVAAEYMAEHATDLIVFSREMMFAYEQRGVPAERQAVWSWRAPIFVC